VWLGLLIGAGLAGTEAKRSAAAEPTAPPAGALQVLITTSELVAGQNRFGFGLAKQDTLLAAARVSVRVYDLGEERARLLAETAAPYQRLELIEAGSRVHIHPDGTRHVHGGVTDVQGLYVTQLTLPRPGPWGLEILARAGEGPVEAARLTVHALAAPRAPAPGMPAPRSRNVIASDVGDLREIDTSDPPDPRLHQTRIADAIAQGRPQVIVFATPRHCTSRICGPVVDVVRTLILPYGQRVAFVHQEIWRSGALQQFAPTVVEWNLRSEPWIFVVDGHGIVRARFEGLTTASELEASVKQMLGLK
jgi:hypothetical protein